LLKELSAPEDHLAGVLAQLPGRVQGGLGLFYGPIGVSGVEAEEGAEGAVFPLELFPILPFQEALVSEPHRAGEAAHQVQDGPLVSLLEEDQAGVGALEDLGRLGLGHSGPHFTAFRHPCRRRIPAPLFKVGAEERWCAGLWAIFQLLAVCTSPGLP
jgi:hypothetical protein